MDAMRSNHYQLAIIFIVVKVNELRAIEYVVLFIALF